MFRDSLKEKLGRIFDISKVTFDLQSESQEQDCIFVQVERDRVIAKEKRELHRVEGTAFYYSQSDKIPFGQFSKRIQLADRADTKDFFFFNFEENAKTYRNLVRRSFSFVYFFDSQWNPDLGTLNEIDFTITEGG